MSILVTGGVGFIGCNIVSELLREGRAVIVFDNLSRQGTEENLQWLQKKGNFIFIKGDIRNYTEVSRAFKDYSIDTIFHLAAQVAVTTSITNPREDFEMNALGTFNVLEAMRQNTREAILLYSSTNKVYGKMEDIKIIERNQRYEYADLPNGVSEMQPLDFHSPYGCSKGAADQYVKDYSRIYGLRTIDFRQSCIYGYRQLGIEDQGWVAWFIIAAILNRPITIYGDGKQVRDILFVDDFVKVCTLAVTDINRTRGEIYNIGGGPNNVVSLLELVYFLEEKIGKQLNVKFNHWRPGDQKVFVSDISKAERDLSWKPRIGKQEGITKLFEWAKKNLALLRRYF